MTNIEKWPEAFENGIPKVGGRWRQRGSDAVWTIGPRKNHVNATSDKGRRGLCQGGFFDNATFLGFADSVNQGAAAPQAASVVRRPVVRNANYDGVSQQCSCGELGYTAVSVAALWPKAQSCAGVSHHPSGCVSDTTPIVAPPPSLKAAVQQEGLSIPKQETVRHEFYEGLARKHEGTREARAYTANAQVALKRDLTYDEEAKAILEKRVIKKIALQEMGKGDRACFKARNLREFEAIKSAEHAPYFWWKP